MSQPIAHDLQGAPPRLNLTWADVRQKIASTENYYVCTVSADRRPHVVPVLGVWVDDALVFNTQRTARKFRHLASHPEIAVAVAGAAYDFTLEGRATLISDEAALLRVAAAFPVKYTWWHPSIRDQQFYAHESDDPRAVFAVQPRNVFGFGKEDGFSGTRWSFPPDPPPSTTTSDDESSNMGA